MVEIPVLTLKILALSWITAKRHHIHDITASRSTWQQSYDFIVVGAGTAGCAIAYRLTENPNIKVLLLEAGGSQLATWTDMPGLVYNISESAPQIQYFYYSEPQINAAKQFPGGRPDEPLARIIGGSSAHNSMLFNRGNARDYDEWANKYGAKGWSYREVLPYFKKYENNNDPEIVRRYPGYHGTGGPVQITSVRNVPKFLKLLQNTYNGLGFQITDINGPVQTGTAMFQQFIDTRGIRSSSGNAYIDPNPHPKNLHIVTNAVVTRVLFNGTTATGVEFSRNNSPFRVNARREVILTAGAINTPKLLMLSGIGINSHLQEFGIPVLLDLPVGNNYMNHPHLNVETGIRNSTYFTEPPLLSVEQLSDLYYRQRGRLAEDPFLALYFHTERNNQSDWPNALIYNHVNRDRLWTGIDITRIRSRGTIRLMSRDPHSQPRIDPAFLADPQDFEDAVDAVTFAFFVYETALAAQLTIPTFESIGCPACTKRYRYECRESIRCWVRYNSQTSYHPCCSTRMGAVDRDDVVVDPQLRVKNAKQLRVCDASIFPLLPNSNTNAPTHMVAEKCAQMIKDHHNLG